ncbi:MAG TPA: hypothetical protein DDX54_01470 [Rhodospirillaceae bacterium]|jgi:Flp pilus assembly pilin Flp|nr:pilus assembly protein [Alphaproteobacteria bacterium]HBH26060.1 hypothetical protein [Rhodospirillaceae bacterium]
MNHFRFLKTWIADTAGAAAVEFAFIVPVLAVMLIGLVDLGNGILVSQKTVNAAQAAANMLTREASVNVSTINDTVAAVNLIMRPYSENMDVDVHVIGIEFADDEEDPAPIVAWEQSTGAWRITAPSPEERVASIAAPGEAVILVGVHVAYSPIMAGSIVGDLSLEFVSLTRGRQNEGVSCTDC